MADSSFLSIMDEEIDLVPNTPESEKKRKHLTVEEEALKLADYFTASSIKIANRISARDERLRKKANAQLEGSLFEPENGESEVENNVPTANLLNLSPVGTGKLRRMSGASTPGYLFDFEKTPLPVDKREPLRETLLLAGDHKELSKQANKVLPNTDKQLQPVKPKIKLPIKSETAVSLQNSTTAKPSQVVKPNIRATSEGPVTRSARVSTGPSKAKPSSNRNSSTAQLTLKTANMKGNVVKPCSKPGSSKPLLAKTSGTLSASSKQPNSAPPRTRRDSTSKLSESKPVQPKPTVRVSTANTNRTNSTRSSTTSAPKIDLKKPPSTRPIISSRRTSVSTFNADNRKPLTRRSHNTH